jgi:hypothetical protein
MGSGLATYSASESGAQSEGGGRSSWSFDWSGIWAIWLAKPKTSTFRPDRFSQVFRSFFIMQGAKERQDAEPAGPALPVALLRPRRLRLVAAGLRRWEGTRV